MNRLPWPFTLHPHTIMINHVCSYLVLYIIWSKLHLGFWCRFPYLPGARAVAGATNDDTKDLASFWRVTSSLLVAMSLVGCSFGKVVSLRFARVQRMQIRKCHWEHPLSGNPVWALLGAGHGHGHGWYQWYPTVNRNDASCFSSEPPMVFAWQYGHDWKASKVEVVATCCRSIHSTTCCFVAKVSRKSCNIKISWNNHPWARKS